MTDRNKDEFMSVTYRCRSSAGDSKKNNYVIKAKQYETKSTEDILHWYIIQQETFEKTPVKMQKPILARWSYYLEVNARKTP